MLKPIKLKNVIIKNPVILAPMAGVSDLPFRTLVSSFGDDENKVSLTVSEMVPSTSQVMLLERRKSTDKIKRMYEENKSEQLTSIQIFGNNPEIMAKSAKINEDLGADIIDINMGCPVNKIVKNGAGSDLLKNMPLAEQIIKAVVSAVNVPVSVKIRTGWDLNNKIAPEFAKMIESAGASMITIHGRSRSQLYSGDIDFETIRKTKNAVSIPVIGNGDITTCELAKEMIEKTGVDGIMIGRGSYGAPWFLSQVIEFLRTGKYTFNPTIEEKKEIMLNHIKAMIEYYGEKGGMLNSRKHIAWYSKGIRNSNEFRKLINNSSNPDEVFTLIDKLFK